MKSGLLFTILSCLIIEINAQKKVQIFFVANDSINLSEGSIVSHALVFSKYTIYRPSYIEFFLDSSISNFGYIQLQKFDTARQTFFAFRPKIFTDKVIENTDFALLKFTKLDLKFNLIFARVLSPGLYRARIKIFFSRYNRDIRDVTSDWSYFTWKFN